MSAEDDRIRGAAAQRLINDPLYIESFEKVEAAIIKGFSRENLLPEDLQALYFSLRLLKKLRGVLDGYVANGKVAEFDINLLKEK